MGDQVLGILKMNIFYPFSPLKVEESIPIEANTSFLFLFHSKWRNVWKYKKLLKLISIISILSLRPNIRWICLVGLCRIEYLFYTKPVEAQQSNLVGRGDIYRNIHLSMCAIYFYSPISHNSIHYK